MLEHLLRDLRYGARILTRAPGFSAAAVALIALGIGGNTAIFSMIHGILNKPAPGVKADRLVTFGVMVNNHLEIGDPSDSYLNFVYYAAHSVTMQSIAAFRPAPRFTMGTANGTYEVRGQLVSEDYLDTLGVPIARGRQFTVDEARGAGAAPRHHRLARVAEPVSRRGERHRGAHHPERTARDRGGRIRAAIRRAVPGP